MSGGERMLTGSNNNESVILTFTPEGRPEKLFTRAEDLPGVLAAIRQSGFDKQMPRQEQKSALQVEDTVEQDEVVTNTSTADKQVDSCDSDDLVAYEEEDTVELPTEELAEAYQELKELEEMKQQLEAARMNKAVADYAEDRSEYDDYEEEEEEDDENEDEADDSHVTPPKNKASLQDKIRQTRKNKWRKTRRVMAVVAVSSVSAYAFAPGSIGKGIDYTCENGPQAICLLGHKLVGGAKTVKNTAEITAEKVTGR